MTEPTEQTPTRRRRRQPRAGLSRRQRKLVAAISDGKTVRQAMSEAGYRSTSLSRLLHGNRFQTSIRQLLDRQGLTDTRIARAFKESLEAVETKWLKQVFPPRAEGDPPPQLIGDGYIPKVHADNPTRLRAAEDLAQMRGMMQPPTGPAAQPGVTIIVHGINPLALRPGPRDVTQGTGDAPHA